MIDAFCRIVVSHNAAYAIWLFLFGYAALHLIALWVELRKVRREIDQARLLIGQTAESPGGFVKDYDSFSEQMARLGEIGKIWSEFTESLLLPSDNGRERIENTRSPLEYFSLHSVIAGRVSPRYYANVSNTLVGFGILGTFVGLAAGIQLAFGDLKANNDLTAGLAGLLGGAFLSFSKSAVAILMSIVYGPIEKRMVNKLENDIHHFCRGLDVRLVRVASEQIAARQLKQLEDQTRQLTRFNTDLAVSIAGALDEKLASQFSPALAKILDAVGQLRSDRGETNERMLQGMVEQFRSTMSGAAGTEMSALASTLKALQGTVSESLNEMRLAQAKATQSSSQAVLEMESSLQRTQKIMEQSLTTMVSTLQNVSQESTTRVAGQLQAAGQTIVQGVSQQSDALQRSVSQLDGILRGWASVANETSALVVRLNESAGTMDSAGHKFQALSLSMDHSATSLQSAGDRIALAASKNSDAALELRSGVETIKTSLQQCQEAWSDYQKRFERTDESLASVFGQLDEGLNRYSERVRDYLTELDRHLGAATQSLASAVSPLADGLEDLPAEVKALGSHVEAFALMVNRLPSRGNGS